MGVTNIVGLDPMNFSNYIFRLLKTSWKAFVGLEIGGLGKYFSLVLEWISQVTAEKNIY
jgi:hypothetical protein